MLMTHRYWILLVILLILPGCDMEKLTSYSYEDSSGKDSTSFSGHIYRKDTREPVAGAKIVINLRKAIADSNGYYLLQIQYNDDINRNLPVPFFVTAKNFALYEERVEILPEPMRKSINIVWAVPIINEPIVDRLDGEMAAAAFISDYQGVETIKLVAAYFENGPRKFKTVLSLRYKQNNYTGFFKSQPFLFKPDLGMGWQIEATDEDGRTDFLYILRDGRIIRRDPE